MAKKTKQEAQQERLSLAEKRNRQERRNKKSRKEREQEKRRKKQERDRRKQKNIPTIAQQSIPYIRMLQDGICQVTKTFFSKTIQFYDINYQLALNEDKTTIFENYCDFLNYLVCITKQVWTGCTGISGCRGFSAYNGLQSAESIRTSGKCSQRDQQTSPDADWTICSELSGK